MPCFKDRLWVRPVCVHPHQTAAVITCSCPAARGCVDASRDASTHHANATHHDAPLGRYRTTARAISPSGASTPWARCSQSASRSGRGFWLKWLVHASSSKLANRFRCVLFTACAGRRAQIFPFASTRALSSHMHAPSLRSPLLLWHLSCLPQLTASTRSLERPESA